MTDLPRRVLRVTGDDRDSFLQGLVTNDVKRLSDGLVYAAMLTPQGKYIADFFLVPAGDAILIDVAEPLADTLAQRLSMYRLRARVDISASDVHVTRGIGPVPEGAFADPRHPGMGWRGYDGQPGEADVDWAALRIEYLVPEYGTELSSDAFILEHGFERLHGVDFRKGCYVGQEVTARMKHKTDLRKGLAQVAIDGDAAPGTEITAGDKPAGVLGTRAGDRALAFLRFDRAEGPMQAGTASLHRTDTGA